MTNSLPIRNIKLRQSIRWKLAAAFVAVACAVAAFVGVAIIVHDETIERAGQLEATHVAELVADAAMQDNGFKPRLQAYVSHLYSVRKRDFVIVDANKKEVADANPEDVGKQYEQDHGDEVGKTIRDGRSRTYVERGGRNPDALGHLVVPIRHGASNVGAVIIEYSQIREELFAAERDEFYLITAT